jgi:hypothetical protein
MAEGFLGQAMEVETEDLGIIELSSRCVVKQTFQRDLLTGE